MQLSWFLMFFSPAPLRYDNMLIFYNGKNGYRAHTKNWIAAQRAATLKLLCNWSPRVKDQRDRPSTTAVGSWGAVGFQKVEERFFSDDFWPSTSWEVFCPSISGNISVFWCETFVSSQLETNIPKSREKIKKQPQFKQSNVTVQNRREKKTPLNFSYRPSTTVGPDFRRSRILASHQNELKFVIFDRFNSFLEFRKFSGCFFSKKKLARTISMR